MLTKIGETLTSKKFWALVGGAVTLAVNEQWAEFAALIASYFIGQGAVDVVHKLRAQPPPTGSP